MSRALLPLAFFALVPALGCQRESRPDRVANKDEGKPEANANAEGPADPDAGPTKADETKTDPAKDLGRLDATLLPLGDMLGAAPQVVEGHLGPPKAKGGRRESCVRFVPDRVWFSCESVWQRYEDKNGTLSGVRVFYEDGVATAIGLESIPGQGPFDPRKALEIAGVHLPGEPTLQTPEASVRIWSWFNNQARLKVKGREYKVEVSVIGDDWHSAKVEVILNDRLNADEKARLLPTKGADDSKADQGADAKG